MTPMSTSDARKRLRESVERLEARTRAHWIDPPRFTVPAHVFTQENPMTEHDRHEELVALLTEIRDALEPPKVEVNAPDFSHVNESIWRAFANVGKPADDLPGEPADVTEEPHRVHDHGIDPSCRERVGSGGLLRGECIDTAPDVDPDETHPLPCNACYGSGSAEIQEQVAEDVDRLRTEKDEWRAMAREADADSKRQYVRAVKAEAERNALRSRLNALRMDLSPGGLTWSVYDALRRDDERAKGEQA